MYDMMTKKDVITLFTQLPPFVLHYDKRVVTLNFYLQIHHTLLNFFLYCNNHLSMHIYECRLIEQNAVYYS
jgi:hypothetical protein